MCTNYNTVTNETVLKWSKKYYKIKWKYWLNDYYREIIFTEYIYQSKGILNIL